MKRALILLEQLHTNLESRFRAALMGGPEFIGWAQHSIPYVLAELYDRTTSAAHWAAGIKEAPEALLYPRPGHHARHRAEPAPQATTIAEFDIGLFERKLAGH